MMLLKTLACLLLCTFSADWAATQTLAPTESPTTPFEQSILINASSSQVEISGRTSLTQFSMHVRTCVRDAVLLYAEGASSNQFILAKIAARQFVLLFDFGAGLREIVDYNAVISDCDWHAINVTVTPVSVIVDIDGNSQSDPRGDGALFALNSAPLLLGSSDRNSITVARLANAGYLLGCIRSLSINSEAQAPLFTQLTGVHLNGTIQGCNVELLGEPSDSNGVDESTAIGFLGLISSSYAQYYRTGLGISDVTVSDTFSLNARTRESFAVLFFAGRGSQYYMLELFRGTPTFRFMLDSSTAGSIQSSTRINDGEWHSISVSRVGREVTMTVDDLRVQITANGPRSIMSFPDDFFLGGIPSNYNFPSSLGQVSDYDALIGCIQGFTFNGVSLGYNNVLPTSVGVNQSCPGRSDVCNNHNCPSTNICIDIWNEFECGCPDGWSGPDCDINIDECELGLCQNSANCIDGNNSFTCECAQGFMGEFCDLVDLCNPNPCQNGGNCSQSTETAICSCYPYNWGSLCEFDCDQGACADNEIVFCNQSNGLDRQCGQCDPGFYGDGCDSTCPSITTCDSSVVCNKMDGSNPQCDRCIAGYFGPSCQQPCDATLCANSQNVTSCNKNDGSGVRCSVCSSGKYGVGANVVNDCTQICQDDHCLTINQCDQVSGNAQLCQGCQSDAWGERCQLTCRQGNCIGDIDCNQIDGGNRICSSCQPGYFGVDCEQRCSQGNCSGSVSCDQNGGNLRCTSCSDGYWGQAAQGNLGNDCANQCQDIQCDRVLQCDATTGAASQCQGCTDSRYQGTRCERLCTSENCIVDSQSPTCSQSGLNTLCSSCTPGWYGSNCSSECQPGIGCRTDGDANVFCEKSTGIMLSCSQCYDGFFGTLCRDRCAQGNCIGDVQCRQDNGENRQCSSCIDGYYGVDCTQQCDSGNCLGTVSCLQQNGGSRNCSRCIVGWEGTDCETEINECGASSCSGHGNCVDLLGSFRCECSDGWIGNTCSIPFSDTASFFSQGAVYLAFAPTSELSLTWTRLSFQFMTVSSNALLMYATGFGQTQDFSIELINGNLKLWAGSWPTPITVRSTQSLSDGRWHRVNFSMDTLSLTIDSQSSIQIASPTNFTSTPFNAEVALYLGGVVRWDTSLFNRLTSKHSFAGCMRQVLLDAVELNLLDSQSESGVISSCPRSISQASPCAGSPCGANGVCVDLWDRYVCQCNVGYSGDRCNEIPVAATFSEDSLVDFEWISLTSPIASNGFDFDLGFTAALEFRTRSFNAQIFTLTGESNPAHMFSMTIQDGYMTLSYSATTPTNLTEYVIPIRVDTGWWQSLVIEAGSINSDDLIINQLTARINQTVVTFATDEIQYLKLWDGNLRIGAEVNQVGATAQGIVGCIRGVRVGLDEIQIQGIPSRVVSSQLGTNVTDGCIGQDICSSDQNHCDTDTTTCVDIWNSFECSCLDGFEVFNTSTCVDIDDCANDPCFNYGSCTDEIGGFNCNCTNTGFEGETCQDPENDCGPESCLNNGICNDLFRSFNCTCPVQYSGLNCAVDVNECSGHPCTIDEFCSEIEPTCLTSICQDSWIGYICNSISTCTIGETYETVGPTNTSDRVCSPTTTCNSTQFESTPPTVSTDRGCTTLSPECQLELEFYQEFPPTDTSDRLCSPCHECSESEFVSTNCSLNANTICTNCTICDDDQFQLSACTDYQDTICVTPTTCDFNTEFITVDYTATTDRVCGNLTICDADQFAHTIETSTSDRVCTSLSPVCSLENDEFESAAPSETSDRQCTQCSRCFFGQYIYEPCTNVSDVLCRECECQNSGRCFAATDRGFECQCTNEYYGALCENINPCLRYTLDALEDTGEYQLPCQNNGQCNRVNDTFECECDQYHVGDNCEVTLCIPGESNPCAEYQHAVGCLPSNEIRSVQPEQGDQNGYQTCLCAPGWGGPECSIRDSACVANPCLFGGVCDGFNDDSYTCTCTQGYSGLNCEIAPITLSPTTLGSQNSNSAGLLEESENDIEVWIWIVVAVGCLVLVLVAFVCYRRSGREMGYTLENDAYSGKMGKSEIHEMAAM